MDSPPDHLSWNTGLLNWESPSALGGWLHHGLPSVLGFSGLDWNYNTSFTGSAADRQQIAGLLSLRNCVSQFLMIYIG